MLKNFAEIINDAIFDRAGEVEGEFLGSDQRYQELCKQINDVFHQIEQHLSPELRRLLFDLDSLTGEQEGLAYEIMYKQGLIDGWNLKQMLFRVNMSW